MASWSLVFADGEVTDIEDLVVDVVEEEPDEGSNLGFLLHDAGIGVEEERAGERILAGLSGFGIRFDAIDGEGLQVALIFLEVSIAEVTDGIGTAFNALDEDVVVFRELHVRQR